MGAVAPRLAAFSAGVRSPRVPRAEVELPDDPPDLHRVMVGDLGSDPISAGGTDALHKMAHLIVVGSDADTFDKRLEASRHLVEVTRRLTPGEREAVSQYDCWKSGCGREHPSSNAARQMVKGGRFIRRQFHKGGSTHAIASTRIRRAIRIAL